MRDLFRRFLMIVAAVALHFSFCRWVPSTDPEAVIAFVGKGLVTVQDRTLVTRPNVEHALARDLGAVAPVLLVVGAFVLPGAHRCRARRDVYGLGQVPPDVRG